MLPQRRAGRDLFWWLTRLGLMRVTVDSRLGRRASRREFIIGTNRRQLERARVRFRPRLVVNDDAAYLADRIATGQRGAASATPTSPSSRRPSHGSHATTSHRRADDGNPGTQDGRVRALPRNHTPRHGRTVAGLLGLQGFNDQYRPVVVAERIEPMPTDTPLTVIADKTFDEVPDPAVVLVPGGGRPLRLWLHPPHPQIALGISRT
jgi:hypothetical protein